MTDTSNPTHALTEADAGLWFAGSSSRTAHELCSLVILEALDRGWVPDDAADLRTLADSVDGWLDDIDAGQALSDAANEAESYLNGIAPDGYACWFDDGFGMWNVAEAEAGGYLY